LSDHIPLTFGIPFKKPASTKKTIQYRKLREINGELFIEDVMQSDLIETPASDVEALVVQYHSILSAILEKHAPMIRREVIIRPKSPWYTDDIRSAKQAKRKAERMWRKTKLTVHLDILKNARVDIRMKCSAAKKQYYMNKISEADNKQKELFSISKTLLHRRKCTQLPPHDNEQNLANQFATFFTEKIRKIRASLGCQKQGTLAESKHPCRPSSDIPQLATLKRVTED
jgi:hypothetical protein